MKYSLCIISFAMLIYAAGGQAVTIKSIEFQSQENGDVLAITTTGGSLAMPKDSLDRTQNNLILRFNDASYKGAQTSIDASTGKTTKGSIQIQTIIAPGKPDQTTITIPLKSEPSSAPSVTFLQQGPIISITLAPKGATEKDLVAKLEKQSEIVKQTTTASDAAIQPSTPVKAVDTALIAPIIEYETAGRRDPFRPLIRTEPRRDRINPQRQFPPSLTGGEVVSIISNIDGDQACLFKIGGAYYFLREGDLLIDGTVGEISQFTVTFLLSEEGWLRPITVGIKERVEIVR